MNENIREVDAAIATSRVLDDGNANESPMTTVNPAQRRVHESLSNRAGVPWTASDDAAIDRVFAALNSGTSSSRHVRWNSLPTWSIAAAILLAAGALTVYYRSGSTTAHSGTTQIAKSDPTTPITPTPIDRSASDPAGESPLLALFNAPASGDRALGSAIDEPLLDEASLLGEDATRAAKGVLARLPVRWE